MTRPVRSRLEGLFSLTDFTDDFNSCEKNPLFTKKRKRIKPKKSKHNDSIVAIKESVKKPEPKVAINFNSIKQEQAMQGAKRFVKLYGDNRFNEFKEKEWREYFAFKAREHGVKYIGGDPRKEHGTMKGLMYSFTADEIKTMIDFLWDCDHEMYAGKPLGIYMLSKSWGKNDIYQNSVLWKDGKFKTASQIKREKNRESQRNRNWISNNEDKPQGVTIRI